MSKKQHRWNLAKLNKDLFKAAVEKGKDTVLSKSANSEDIVNLTMNLIRKACNASMPRKYNQHGNKKSAYWWTEEIARLRKECLIKRRSFTRKNKKDNTSLDKK